AKLRWRDHATALPRLHATGQLRRGALPRRLPRRAVLLDRPQLARLRACLSLRTPGARRASRRTLRGGRNGTGARLETLPGRLAPALDRGPLGRPRRLAAPRRDRGPRPPRTLSGRRQAAARPPAAATTGFAGAAWAASFCSPLRRESSRPKPLPREAGSPAPGRA